MGMSMSEDNGRTWSKVRSLNKPCIMGFTSIVRLKNGDYLGMYHNHTERDRNELVLWQTVSKDGGLTWGESRMVGAMDGRSPCEPCVFRASDGNRLVCLARENLRKGNSLMMVSEDEGETWTPMKETCWGLTGDRHVARYLPDGRLIVAFRDMAQNSPTRGHFVAWVGQIGDVLWQYSGQYRIKLLHSYAGWDCGYPGLEILPDGTIVATTYVKYAPGPDKHSVVSVRFRIEDTDRMLQ